MSCSASTASTTSACWIGSAGSKCRRRFSPAATAGGARPPCPAPRRPTMLEVHAADLAKASDAEVGDFIRKHGAYVLRGAIDAATIKSLKDALINALAEDDATHGREH